MKTVGRHVHLKEQGERKDEQEFMRKVRQLSDEDKKLVLKTMIELLKKQDEGRGGC